MKKSLVLAMAMAMGVTASAYAANPFSDVPAGHWAYDAVAKLADAGVVDGYGAAFGGDKLMTRYEMAQLVAKAMAKGANTDKLAAEFADELDALGVRVAKLEKKVDNVKVTGQIRYSYRHDEGKGVDKNMTQHRLRNRIFVEGTVNKNWTYTGMLENNHNLGVGGSDDIKLVRAYLDGRIGGLKVRAGHWNEFFINDTILDDMIDGIQLSYDFNGINVFGVAAKWAGDAYGDFFDNNVEDHDRLYILGASGKVGPVDLAFNYFKADGNLDRNIYSVNADWGFAKDFGLTYRYMWTDDRVVDAGSKDGWFAQLNFKGADPAKANTWGLRARYFDQPQNVFLYPTYDLNAFDDGQGGQGYEGWNIGGDYTFAKNIMWSLDYYDTESKAKVAGSKLKDRRLYSQLWFFF